MKADSAVTHDYDGSGGDTPMSDADVLQLSTPTHRQSYSEATMNYAAAAAEHASKAPREQQSTGIVSKMTQDIENATTKKGKLPQTRFAPKPRTTESESQPEVSSPWRLVKGVGKLVWGSSDKSPQKEPMQDSAELFELECELEELREDNLRLEKAVENQKRKCKEQLDERSDQHIKSTKQDAKRHQQELDTLRRSYANKLASEVERVQKEATARAKQKYNEEVARLRLEANNKLETARQDTVSAREQKAAIEKKCRGYEIKIRDLEKTVAALQAEKLRSVESTQWAPLRTSEVEEELSSILIGLRQWAQKHIPYTIEEVTNKRFDSFAGLLMSLGCLENPEKLRNALLKNTLVHKPGRASGLLVSAAAASFIFRNIIEDPFFAFAGAYLDDPSLLSAGLGHAMRDYVRLVARDNVESAEALRCQMLRALDPKLAASSRNLAVAVKTRDFICGVLLVDQDEECYAAMEAGLHEIVSEVAELSWKMWTRKPRPGVYAWDSLVHQAGKGGPLSYEASSEALEADKLHNRALGPNKHALDGKEVLLLCSPAVVAAGNIDGGDYHKYDVLKKAVVWMGKDLSIS